MTIFFCRGCNRYQRPPWVALEWESRELLALCLKKIKGLNKEVKVRSNISGFMFRSFSFALCQLVDAGFVYTEPHSRRIKVKLTIQKEVSRSLPCFTQSSCLLFIQVMGGLILQQVFIVEFLLANQQCTDCQKSYTEHTWNTVVQVRQKVVQFDRASAVSLMMACVACVARGA